MRTGRKIGLTAGVCVVVAVLGCKPLLILVTGSAADKNQHTAAARVDADVAGYARQVLQLSTGPQGLTEAQLDRLDQDMRGWDHVRTEDAAVLRALTIRAVESYSSAFGGTFYDECRRITFHDLGTPAAGFAADEKIDCQGPFGFHPSLSPSR